MSAKVASPARTEQIVAERIQKVGSVEVRDANRPLKSGEEVYKAQCVACHGAQGEGGMGTVYEARQENPRRTVALKVIRAGYLSPELLRRFSQESQVLGRLQHPGIAQVYEAGFYDVASGAATAIRTGRTCACCSRTPSRWRMPRASAWRRRG